MLRNKPYQPSALWLKLMGSMERLQRQWATFWQQRESRWSLRQKKVYLVLFCIAFGGISLCIGINAFFSKTLTVPMTRAPEYIPPRKPMLTLPKKTRTDSMEVRALLRQMDSMMQTTTGQQELNRQWAKRPGFKDSILMLRDYYNIKQEDNE